MSAGYSDTPLIKKLGVKDDMKVLIINQPGDYFDLIAKNISNKYCVKNEPADFIHLFIKTKKDFELEMNKIKKRMKPTTIIWVSWYKKSSKIITDVTEDAIRDHALQNNLVDVKVCAVSNIWSGLKLVVPLTKR